MYVNGIANASTVTFSGNILNSDYYLLVGGLDAAILMDGTIDEPRIYNRALTSGEVTNLYNSNLAKYATNKWLFSINMSGINDGSYRYTGTIIDLA